MTDTVRSRDDILALFAVNTTGETSNQDALDFIVSAMPPTAAVGVASATGATVDHNAMSIVGANVKMFPESDVLSTSTSGGATTLGDTTQAWTTNQFATHYVSALTTEAIFATIASNTADTLTVDAWTDADGDAIAPPGAGAIYYVIPASSFLDTINGGQGDQLLSVTVADIFALPVSVVIRTGVGNVITSTAADVTVTPAKRFLFQRDRDTNVYTGVQ